MNRISCALAHMLMAAGLTLVPACDSDGPQNSAAPNADGSGNQPGGKALLTDVTAEAGIDFVHDKHETGRFRHPDRLAGSGGRLQIPPRRTPS